MQVQNYKGQRSPPKIDIGEMMTFQHNNFFKLSMACYFHDVNKKTKKKIIKRTALGSFKKFP